MKQRFFLQLSGVVTALLMMAGCADHEEAAETSEEKSASEIGHGFKEGRGVFLTDETIRTLGVQTAEPQEKMLASDLKVPARVYAPGRATASLDSTQAIAVASATKVNVGSPLNITAKLTRLDRHMEKSLGQVEALIEFDTSDQAPQPGDVVPVTFASGTEQSQLVVPTSSVLQAGAGNFVFVANGGHFLRTRVQLGTQRDGWTAIPDGLLAGDFVVTNGVSALWCLELQATKAGAGCAH